MAGKGVGAVAARPLDPGQLIASEKPIFVVPWWARKEAAAEPFPGTELKRAVEEAVDMLDERDSQRFWALCDSKCQQGRCEVSAYCIDSICDSTV